MTLRSLYFYKFGDGTSNSSMQMIDIAFHTIILIHCILFAVKILFELSLGISRYMNSLEFINLAFMMVLVACKYVQIYMISTTHIKPTDSTTFVNFNNLESFEYAHEICLAVCSFFYPFRIFQWLAHFKFFAPAKSVLNTLARTTPGMAVYAFCFIVIVLSFSISLNVILAPYDSNF